MKLPMSWLKDYVDFEATPRELADKLTFSGMEVEGIETVGSTFDGIVVGEIMAIERHPAADRLQVCRVSNGTGEFPVVCGAPDIRVGQKAPFAAVGTTLPGGLTIKRAKLRGVESLGMLCAEDELGLSNDHSSLMAVDPAVPAGTPLVDVVGPPETVLELEVTWNRPDLLNVIGIAREVAALFGTTFRMPEVAFPERGEPVDRRISVRVEDPDLCPRYTARAFSGITLGPSPRWMRDRLSWAGVRPINNVVDITNFVMLECGQPLHAFDRTQLDGAQIVVRRAAPGETMATLDGIERPITPAMLMIADASRPVAVAGVMGGAGSEIRDNTCEVLLESACFDPASIHATSTALGLQTESSHRFERRVDPELADWASRRAAALMVELCGATAARGVIDIDARPPAERLIPCRFARVNGLLGIRIPASEIMSIFGRLGLPVTAHDDVSCTVRAPSFRPDLEMEADLIEEVARMHGMDAVPAAVPSARLVPDADDAPTRAVAACRTTLIGLGLTEVMHYSFVSDALLDRFSADEGARRVRLPNPVSADYGVMRDSLLPQMIETLGRNHARQVTDVAFFEIGRVFFKTVDGRIGEENRLSIGLTGKVGRGLMDRRREAAPDEVFLWLKGIVETLFVAQHVQPVRMTSQDHPLMDPGVAVTGSADGSEIGRLGLVKRTIRESWRLAEPVAVAEFKVLPLTANTFQVPSVTPVPVFPSVSRDMAVIADVALRHEMIEACIRKSAPRELTEIKLFDIFCGEGIGKGKKSLAYSLTYRSLERTLTDEDANRFHDAIKRALKDGLNVELRES